MVPATAENLAWAIKEVKKTGASTKKGTNIVLKAPPVQEELLEDTKLRSTSGPGRWLSSSTMPGSVVAPSSLRTMSSPLLTVLMELHTSTSWPELITSENHLNPTVWRSPHTMAGLTLSGIQTPLPMILPLSSSHPQLTSTTTLLHPVCQWLETPLTKLNLSQLLDGESPQTMLEESPPSSGWSQISPVSLTRSAMTSMELSETESSALTPPEERDLATEILVAPWS